MYLDTGAMYRAVALAFLRSGMEPSPESAEALLAHVELEVRSDADGFHVWLDGEDVTDAIRTPDVTMASSVVAAIPEVRAKLVRDQRRIARSYESRLGGVVMEGRDIGTVVFPHAEVKVFMRADEAVRAHRRFAEMGRENAGASFVQVLSDIQARDDRDESRSTAPLHRVEGAIEIDTSELGLREQVNRVMQAVRERARRDDV